LELQYKDSLPTASSRRWGGLQMPGMKRLPNQLSGFGDKHKRRWTSGEYEVEQRHQPYFKMHGSSNWYTHDGQNLLVMGGNKDLRMSQHDVLRRYYQEFENHLARKDTRLMVIGYSFSDKHVNDAIRKGVFKGIFLVDPVGWSLVDQHDELKGIPRLGGSTRHMWKTFAGDGFELEKISEFFR